MKPIPFVFGCFRFEESWLVLLRETLVVLAGRFYYVGPCRLCYKGPRSPLIRGTLVVPAVWTWSFPLHGTYARCAMRPWLPPLLVGRLRYMRPLSPQLVVSATCNLLPLLRRLCYVHLKTGPALGHVPALLQNRSSLRARTYIDSIVAMRWRAGDSIS